MEITRVNVYPIESESKLLAFATITVDEELVVKDFKIFDGKKGAFVSFPSEKGSDGEYYDTVFPTSKETRDYITDTILEEFEKVSEAKEEKPSKKSTPSKSGSRRSSR